MNSNIWILSITILILPSLSISILGPVTIVACHVYDVWIMPMKTLEILMAWHVRGGYTENIARSFFSCISDVLFCGLGCFLGVTYATNFSQIIHLFMADAIGKLQL